MSSIFRPPLGSQVLGAIIHSFKLGSDEPEGVFAQKSARRWFKGERVSDTGKILDAAAERIVELELLPPEALANSVLAVNMPHEVQARLHELPPAALAVAHVRRLLEFLILNCDAIAGALPRLTAPVAFPEHAAGACLRLAAADLAFRAAALAWLSGDESERPFVDHWSRPRGTSSWLRELLFGLRRDEAANLLSVHTNTVDAWFDKNTRPSDENLQDIAEVASNRGKGSRSARLRKLRLAYGLRALLQRVSEHVGERQAAEVCQRAVSFANQLVAFPRGSRMTKRDTDLKMALLLSFGPTALSQERWVQTMLDHLRHLEPAPVWQGTLTALSTDWLDYLHSVMSTLGPLDSEDGDELSRALGRPVSDEELARLAYESQAGKRDSTMDSESVLACVGEVLQGGRRAALELKLWAKTCLDSGDRLGAIELLRDALAHDALDAELHFRLGASLWQLGDDDQALTELEIACKLDPGWDRPLVEIAILLGNRGKHQEALVRLEARSRKLRDPTDWFFLHVAYVHERLGHQLEAIEAYVEAISLQPKHAEALDRLAHLYFLRGDKKLGARAAKEAAQLGIPTVCRAWRDGYYSRRGALSRPRHDRGLIPVLVFQDAVRSRVGSDTNP